MAYKCSEDGLQLTCFPYLTWLKVIKMDKHIKNTSTEKFAVNWMTFTVPLNKNKSAQTFQFVAHSVRH